MPVVGGSSGRVLGGEASPPLHSPGPDEKEGQESGGDVRSVKARESEEGAAVDAVANAELGGQILVSLDAEEGGAQKDGHGQNPLETLPALVLQADQGVVGGHPCLLYTSP